MPIEGPLRELGVGDLLQLLCLSRRTGRLTATHAVAERSLGIRLEEGNIVGITGGPTELRIGRLAILWDRTLESEVARALARQKSMPSRRLGEILLEQDAISEAEVRRLLEFQVAECIFELLRWDDGHLSFVEEPPLPEAMVKIRLSTDSVLLDAARRMDEMGEITGLDPRIDPVPRLADQGDRSSSALSLRSLEWAVLAEVDGMRTLRGIARALGRSELDVARALHALLDGGVIELLTDTTVALEREELGPGLPEPGFEEISRLLADGDLEEAGRRVDAMLRRAPDSAVAHTLKGFIEMRAGDAEVGIRHLHRAIELDPLREQAYFHLASALARRGELDRARREIETFLALASPVDPLRPRAEVLLAGLTQTLGALEDGA